MSSPWPLPPPGRGPERPRPGDRRAIVRSSRTRGFGLVGDHGSERPPLHRRMRRNVPSVEGAGTRWPSTAAVESCSQQVAVVDRVDAERPSPRRASPPWRLRSLSRGDRRGRPPDRRAPRSPSGRRARPAARSPHPPRAARRQRRPRLDPASRPPLRVHHPGDLLTRGSGCPHSSESPAQEVIINLSGRKPVHRGGGSGLAGMDGMSGRDELASAIKAVGTVFEALPRTSARAARAGSQELPCSTRLTLRGKRHPSPKTGGSGSSPGCPATLGPTGAGRVVRRSRKPSHSVCAPDGPAAPAIRTTRWLGAPDTMQVERPLLNMSSTGGILHDRVVLQTDARG